MTYNLRHFTDCQSYQDDRRVIIKGWCIGLPITVERFPSVLGFEPKTATIRGPAPNLPCKFIASLSKNFTSFQECLSLNSLNINIPNYKNALQKKKNK